MRTFMVKWLASFAEEEDAMRFQNEQAAVLKRLGMTQEYGVRLHQEDREFHVELWKYVQ